MERWINEKGLNLSSVHAHKTDQPLLAVERTSEISGRLYS